MPEIEAKADDPAFYEGRRKMEDMLLFAYRSFAHHFPPAPELAPEESARLRAEVEDAIAAGKPLAGRDLTGADLRGVRLTGVTLRSALLELVDFTGCDLSGAVLTRAVLTRANLVYADFSHAVIEDADFPHAQLFRARFHQTQERGAVFTDRSAALGDDEELRKAKQRRPKG